MFQGAPGAFCLGRFYCSAAFGCTKELSRLEESLGLAVVELKANRMSGTHIDAKAYRYIGCSPVPYAVLLTSRPCVKRLLPYRWKEIRLFTFT